MPGAVPLMPAFMNLYKIIRSPNLNSSFNEGQYILLVNFKIYQQKLSSYNTALGPRRWWGGWGGGGSIMPGAVLGL